MVTFGSSSRSGGSPWAGLLALWPPTVTHAVGYRQVVRCVSGVPSLATAFISSRTFSRIAPSISGPQYSPQPRDFGDHEKAEGPPRGERRKLPISLSRQAKTQKSWLSIPGRPLCAARRRWFLGAAMGEEYPLILVCTGELPAGGFSAEGCPFSQSGSLQNAACPHIAAATAGGV